MLAKTLLLALIILSVIGFIEGINIAINEPFNILIGALSLLLVNFLFLLLKKKIQGIKITKNSIIWKVIQNQNLKYLTITILWILSFGNFIFANSFTTVSYRGIEYIDAIILSFIAFVILTQKVK